MKIATLCSLKTPVRVPSPERPVVAHEDEQQGVVELAGRLQEVDQATDLRVGVLHVAGVDLGHPGEQPAFVVGEAGPSAGTPSSIGDSSALSGTMPSSFCRAMTSSRYASQPMSNWPL